MNRRRTDLNKVPGYGGGGINLRMISQKELVSPGWCGPVGWAPAYEPKGHWFDFHTRHMLGLWPRSISSWGHVRGNQLINL